MWSIQFVILWCRAFLVRFSSFRNLLCRFISVVLLILHTHTKRSEYMSWHNLNWQENLANFSAAICRRPEDVSFALLCRSSRSLSEEWLNYCDVKCCVVLMGRERDAELRIWWRFWEILIQLRRISKSVSHSKVFPSQKNFISFFKRISLCFIFMLFQAIWNIAQFHFPLYSY